MFSLALSAGKAASIPNIKLLQERNTRKVFFEHNEFINMRTALPHYLTGLVTFAYKSGWRLSEITSLTWSQVDRENWIVRLDPGSTKSDKGRIFQLDAELIEYFQKQWKKRKDAVRITPYVFPNKAETGKINNFRKAWAAACKAAGVKKLFHDLRRTAVRNMVRAGIPERVAMQISGHKIGTIEPINKKASNQGDG